MRRRGNNWIHVLLWCFTFIRLERLARFMRPDLQIALIRVSALIGRDKLWEPDPRRSLLLAYGVSKAPPGASSYTCATLRVRSGPGLTFMWTTCSDPWTVGDRLFFFRMFVLFL